MAFADIYRGFGGRGKDGTTKGKAWANLQYKQVDWSVSILQGFCSYLQDLEIELDISSVANRNIAQSFENWK